MLSASNTVAVSCPHCDEYVGSFAPGTGSVQVFCDECQRASAITSEHLTKCLALGVYVTFALPTIAQPE